MKPNKITKFIKNDLKVGMIVRTRGGIYRMFMGEFFMGRDSYALSCDYAYNLRHDTSIGTFNKNDIMAVYNVSNVHLTSMDSYFDGECLDVLWERDPSTNFSKINLESGMFTKSRGGILREYQDHRLVGSVTNKSISEYKKNLIHSTNCDEDIMSVYIATEFDSVDNYLNGKSIRLIWERYSISTIPIPYSFQYNFDGTPLLSGDITIKRAKEQMQSALLKMKKEKDALKKKVRKLKAWKKNHKMMTRKSKSYTEIQSTALFSPPQPPPPPPKKIMKDDVLLKNDNYIITSR